MSRVLVTGAQGFIGQVLVRRLLQEGLEGQPLSQLVLVDLSFRDAGCDARVRQIRGSIAQPAVLRAAMATQPDTILHLASVPGGASERDPALDRSVNLDATLQLIEACQALPRPPRFIYSSSIAVYGDQPAHGASEDQVPQPAISYGAHKLACEILLADASRRGWVDGCSLRLPGIVARRDENPGLASGFMSQVFWHLAQGQRITLPVSATGRCWWMSAATCVDNLLHLAGMDSSRWTPQRSFQMPVLHLGIAEVVDALARRFGVPAQQLVHYAPDPPIDRVYASYPPLATPRAEALGLRHDGDVERLIDNALGANALGADLKACG
ncbi:NAD-dependent epimerase/dehydratase family protein [Comamonas endophytica]|uniref:NAD-dependent epimerase/dehydratase family protein n=1 Tax=Comamonas endophytica TaxID=2949090 RepID=A0ABY6GAZ4_9BURK|nr:MULTISPECIES: NAD-dependent epimerase/dehydratase family protein [unclassified Acidovorax]MCD2513756.1 NAD-dependent epimerase/dehydratase family protein [Acidovorax sp. D4N7]UYG52241.1 NAD-dependent epimerase/dehydratase family protein [Acidovorax sp. 5MLIR]